MYRLLLLSIFSLFGTTSAWSQALDLVVLGTAQDAGKPQIGCEKACCEKGSTVGKVVALAVLDSTAGLWYLFEATPDITTQCATIDAAYPPLPQEVFVSHAHIGHYTGLMYFGREACNAASIPVHCGARMHDFLLNNAPWSQLITLQNIVLQPHSSKAIIKPEKSPSLRVEPLAVPHRDEFSETFGFIIHGANKRALFIPDIDKWEAWDLDIDSLITTVDYAFLDATFYDINELPGRNLAEVPHPFVVESMARWQNMTVAEKAKIYFIHFNHSNPLWEDKSAESEKVKSFGFNIARLGQKFRL
jgi:pyrroloquinoline quinone biosynthesis protein B